MPATPGIPRFTKALIMRRLLQPGFSASAFSLALAMPFSAQVQAQEVDLNIPAQSLASALDRKSVV